MIKKLPTIIAAFLLIVLFAALPAIAAPDELIGPILKTTDYNYENDTVVNYNTTLLPAPGFDYDNTPTALSVNGDGVFVTANEGFSISINVIDDTAYTLTDRTFKGIEAINGATIDFRKNEVSIFAPGKGVYVNNGGKIYLGDDSKIYAYGFRSGIAIFALNGEVTIGHNARLIGTAFNESSGVVVAHYDSKVKIGDNAYILSTSLENEDLNQSNPVTPFGGHQAVHASYGGEITIGNDSRIIVEGSPDEIGNVAVSVGARSDSSGEIYGKIIIGENAYISTNGRFASYVIQVWAKDSYIEVGKGATISSTGTDETGGVSVRYGGEAKIGDDSTVTTTGTSSYGLYALFNNSSPYQLPQNRLSTPTITTGDNVTITTLATSSFGICAWNRHTDSNYTDQGVRINLGNENHVITWGNSAHAIYSNGNDTIVNAGNDLTINTYGESAYGLYVTKTSSTTGPGKINIGTGATIITEKKLSYGIGAWNGAVITMGDNTTITTNGVSGRGIYSYSATEISSVIIGDNSEITTNGNDAPAIYIWDKAQITVGNNSIITTTGDYSYSIITINETLGLTDGSVTLGEGSTVITKGIEAHAVYFLNDFKGSLNIEKTTIITEGINSDIFFIDTFSFEDSSTDPWNMVFNNLTAFSLKGNLITGVLRNGEDITFTFNNSILKGDILSTGYKESDGTPTPTWTSYYTENINLILNGSTTWEGSRASSSYLLPASDEDAKAEGFSWLGTSNNVNLTLNEYSSWLVGKNSNLTSVNMFHNSTSVKFLYDTETNSYYSAEINELSGSGTIYMNIDLLLSGQGNLLKLGKASGQYKLALTATKLGKASNIKLVEVSDISLNPEFILSTGETVKLGAYSYSLDNITNPNEWVLTLQGLDPEIIDDSRKMVIGLFEFLKSIDASLSDSLFRNKNDVWATSYYELQKFDDKPNSLDMKQNIWGMTIGMDLIEIKALNLGMFIGLNVAYQEIAEDLLVDTSNFTLGAYFNYLKNDFIISGYFRGNSYFQDLKLKANNKSLNGSLNVFGYNAGIQALKKFLYINYEKAYFAPKVKISYSYLGEIYKDFGEFELESLSSKSIVTWLGIQTGLLVESTKIPFELYLEAAWVHDNNPSVTVIIGEEKEIILNKNRLEIGGGVNIITSNKSEFKMDFKYMKSKDMMAPINIKIEGSFTF